MRLFSCYYSVSVNIGNLPTEHWTVFKVLGHLDMHHNGSAYLVTALDEM
jgi:hypothetical protein